MFSRLVFDFVRFDVAPNLLVRVGCGWGEIKYTAKLSRTADVAGLGLSLAIKDMGIVYLMCIVNLYELMWIKLTLSK